MLPKGCYKSVFSIKGRGNKFCKGLEGLSTNRNYIAYGLKARDYIMCDPPKTSKKKKEKKKRILTHR